MVQQGSKNAQAQGDTQNILGPKRARNLSYQRGGQLSKLGASIVPQARTGNRSVVKKNGRMKITANRASRNRQKMVARVEQISRRKELEDGKSSGHVGGESF